MTIGALLGRVDALASEPCPPSLIALPTRGTLPDAAALRGPEFACG